MTAPIILAAQWPEWADRHCWDKNGAGWFYGPACADSESWFPKARLSDTPMPAGWDWRVPVMRPDTGNPVAAPAIDLDLVRVLAQGAVDALTQNKTFPADVAAAVGHMRRLLALIDEQAHAAKTGAHYADAEALVAHLSSLVDDDGQGGDHWEPAKAAIAGIRAWQAGTIDLPDLCDICHEREEARTDAEGIPFCQQCWDECFGSEQPSKGEGVRDEA